jgi:hypothetical protein
MFHLCILTEIEMATEYDEFEFFNEDQVVNRATTKNVGRRRYFPSNVPQAFIRNAVTGVKYPYRVGSKEQSLLYKMIDATGVCNSEGFVVQRDRARPPTLRNLGRGSVLHHRSDIPHHNTNHLFYDTPEQCMQHLNITLSSDEINRWRLAHIN